MSASVNTRLLRSLALDQLPFELSALQAKLPDDVLTDQLLRAIECGLLPTSVFNIWLGICRSPLAVRRALEQKISVKIRFQGIAWLKRGLESAQWGELWEGLGDTKGLLNIFSDLSVREVRSACKAISRSTKDGDVSQKSVRVTELFQGLHPNIFPDAVPKTNDFRPLTKFYQELVPSCTTELVKWVTSQEQEGRWRHVKEKELIKYHPESLWKTAVDSVLERRTSNPKYKERLRKISIGYPPQWTPSGMILEERFSSSMSFALQLLRHVVTTNPEQLEASWVLENLIRSLLRRAMSKRVSWSKTQEIVSLTTEFLQQHPAAAQALTSNRRDILHLIAICWSRRSTLFEAQLKQTMEIVFDSRTSLEDVGNLLNGVPRSRRDALLHVACKEAMGIESDADFSKARGCLPVSLLNALQAPDALKLFKCLRKAKGDTNLIELGPYSSVLVSTRTPDVYEGDPDINYMVLLNRNKLYEEAKAHATSMIELRKSHTQTASNRERRAEYALSVWACASASGSLTLLSETVHWAHRFIRDSLTAAKLFSNYYDETYILLSGFRAHGATLLGVADLGIRVKKANKIMLDLLDIACSAVCEPHFRASDWHKTLAIFTQVIKRRVEFCDKMEDTSAVSDDELYQILWSDTIPMLLQVETILTGEEFAKLGADNSGGVLDWNSIFSAATLRPWRKHAWDFVDNLARARDSMWVKIRATRYPEVLSLPEPFPRGLPIQNLLSSWDLNLPRDLQNSLPYLYTRVKSTLFISPQAALRPVVADKTVLQAIGTFVDNYNYALGVYIPLACDKQVKQRRFAAVWEYLIGPLSEGRMTREEAAECWFLYIPYYMRDATLLPEEDPPRWPLLPKLDDPLQIQEWNPLNGRPVDVTIREARDLGQSTYLDLCTFGMQSQPARPSFSSCIKLIVPQIPEKKRQGYEIWKNRVGPEAREATALSALLYLDAKYGSKSGLLSSPFPSPDDVRFPCVYLEEEFLSSEDLSVPAAVREACEESSPLLLMHKVAATVVEKYVSEKSSPPLEAACYELLRTLNDSDRPGLAFDLALRVITDRPDASSWHRILFDNAFLNRLPASEAKMCIETYAEAIRGRLEAVKSKSDSRAVNDTGENPEPLHSEALGMSGSMKQDQPLIKVTTLKTLAQLLQNSAYIGDDVSLDILTKFSQNVSHVDVRVSILKTFLSKLEVNRSELWEFVISALEIFIPIAGSMNEREPTGSRNDVSKDQEQIDQELTRLPKLNLATESTWKEDLPMLGALMEYQSKLEDGQLLNLYTERVVLPLLRVLEEQIAEWTRFFPRKYAKGNADVLNIDIPPIPKGLRVVDMVLNGLGVKSYPVPQSLLDKYVAYLIFMIEPPVSIRTLNQTLQDDPGLKDTPEVVTWLKLYGNSLSESWSTLLPLSRIDRLKSAATAIAGSHVTMQSYDQAFRKIFRILVAVDSPNYERLTPFIATMNACGNRTATVKDMIVHVSSLRTREWERDSDRSPPVLPDVFPWRLSLLSYPESTEPGPNSESEYRAFTNQLSTIIDEISGGMYHEKLRQIKVRVNYIPQRVLAALFLGDISKTRLSWLTTPDLLRIDVAAFLLQGAGTSDIKPYAGRLKTLLVSWTQSDDEEVRKIGYRASNDLLKRNVFKL